MWSMGYGPALGSRGGVGDSPYGPHKIFFLSKLEELSVKVEHRVLACTQVAEEEWGTAHKEHTNIVFGLIWTT